MMSRDSWERYLNSDSGFRFDENAQRFHDHGADVWHTEGGTLHQDYNNIRTSEVQTRNQEILLRVIHFYFSRNGVIVLVISVLLCLITATLTPEGLFFWNIVLALIIWGFYEITVKIKVRDEWHEIWEEMETI
jgi:hypothetical protein